MLENMRVAVNVRSLLVQRYPTAPVELIFRRRGNPLHNFRTLSARSAVQWSDVCDPPLENTTKSYSGKVAEREHAEQACFTTCAIADYDQLPMRPDQYPLSSCGP